MALLPSKELLDGTKNPETTTGEFRVAMGHMREYLCDLLGENSTDRQEARSALGAVSADDIQKSRHTSAIATGSADALVATFNPPVVQLTNAMTLTVRAIARNETSAPTFRADATSVLPIVKGNDQPLEKGDIHGEGYWLDLRFDGELNKWVLLNPASSIVTSGIPATQATGTPDAIVAKFDPPIFDLKNGMKVSVRATAANTSSEPYLQIENFEAYPLVKGIGQPLAAGDIAGEGYWMDCQFDKTNGTWVLLNPVRGIMPSGIPVGTVVYFAANTPPPGYLIADGASLSRTTYPDLFAVIGTTYGMGESSNTFNLPDLIDRFVQGRTTTGQKIEAGLPNVTGTFGGCYDGNGKDYKTRWTGATVNYTSYINSVGPSQNSSWKTFQTEIDASLCNPTYGASDTVQPPALTLLPCIKAFDAILSVAGSSAHSLAHEMTARTSRAEIEPRLSKAWVNFDASSGIMVIRNAKNIKGVVRVEKGVFDVVFDNPIAEKAVTVTASSSALVTSVNRESITGGYYAPTKDRVRIVTGSGSPLEAEDAADINVIIIG